ncbi:hypothetical protein HPB50_012431 [Hyalomma asiaticum]|uniref:Uncharacterized protein n=1 Tax=Hyalomma asiaticum TaxID=266040 RepID=A0ACB7SXK3_HYAAI|nr:hypothetical protein HPB50_012431 [Hyalomma asiaticum]
MPDRAKKFRSKHNFGRSPKKGRCRNLNGAAAAWWEWAPTLPDNAVVSEDVSPSVRGVDSGRVSRVSTDDIINGGVREMASPDSARLVDYDRVDAISNRGVCVGAFPDSVRDDSGVVRVDADVIGASEVREVRTPLQSLVSLNGAIMKPETMQEVQSNVVTLLFRLQQPGSPLPQPYRSPRCRRALYALLLSLAASRNGPPPLNCCARLFNMGLKDTCCEVVELCSQALSCLSLRPQGSGPTGSWPPLRCHRAAWILADGTCQTTPPTLASVGCQAQLQPPPSSPRSPAVAVPQPIKRRAATAMHFRSKRITTLGPVYRSSNQETEVLSDEDGHEYMDYEDDYDDAELEKLQAAETMPIRHPPVNGQGLHERHLGSAAGPGIGGRSAAGATGSTRLVSMPEDSSDEEEGSEEEYDEDEEEGEYAESAEEPCIEAIELESDDIDGSGLPPPESDGAPEEAAITVLEASHEEDQEEPGTDSEAALSSATGVVEAAVSVTPPSSQPTIVVEDGHAEEEQVPPQPQPCETVEPHAEVVQKELLAVTADPGVPKVEGEEPVLVENHAEEEKEPGVFYTVMIDETPVPEMKVQQLDVLVRYFSVRHKMSSLSTFSHFTWATLLQMSSFPVSATRLVSYPE